MARTTTKRAAGKDARPTGDDTAARSAALSPIEQRQVMIIEGEEVLAARVEKEIYVPIRPLCEALGVAPQSQLARIRRDEVLAEDLHSLRIVTSGGPQTVQALHLESLPLWLAGLEPGRVRVDLRDKLRVYKRWCRQRIWEAFAAEMGFEMAPSPSPSPTPTHPTVQEQDVLSLQQVEQFGLALVTLARQHLALQQQHTAEMIEVRGTLDRQGQRLDSQEGRLAAHEERLDRAAGVVRETLRDVKALKARLDPANVITGEQAADLQNTIKAIAHELTRQSAGTGTQTNYYASLFGELHRRFRVSTYSALRLEQYEAAMAWLHDYQQVLTPEPEGAP